MTMKRRCAIYTRKSTEEGLEQAFNSLDAQREACEAYIVSQKHEGWLGLATALLTRTGARAVGVATGLVVTEVAPDGPAARAGLRARDVLLGIAGRRLVPAKDIHSRVRHAAPGSTVIIRVWRDRQSLEIPVIVGTMPRTR